MSLVRRLTGRFAKREREAFEQLLTQDCGMQGCDEQAVALVATWHGLEPACGLHARQADTLGYVVHWPTST